MQLFLKKIIDNGLAFNHNIDLQKPMTFQTKDRKNRHGKRYVDMELGLVLQNGIERQIYFLIHRYYQR